MNGWIGVDLDGTLAEYDHWRGEDHIGAPIPLMVERVKAWRAEGREVRIFTARAYQPWRIENGFHTAPMTKREVTRPIEEWCTEHLGEVLPIVYMKDFGMIELWDDRAIQMIPNTGLRADGVVDVETSARLLLEASPPAAAASPATSTSDSTE